MTQGPLPDTWYRRDFPVLLEITRRMDATRTAIEPDEMRGELGMSRDELQSALLALRRRRLIVGEVSDSIDGPDEVIVITDVSGEAYIRTGLHPDDDENLTALIEVVRQAADQVSDPDEKSRLRRLADALTNASSDVLKLALATYLAARIPS